MLLWEEGAGNMWGGGEVYKTEVGEMGRVGGEYEACMWRLGKESEGVRGGRGGRG